MSQKVRSPRKRLQIDHDEFVPPTDIYEGSTSPRPDDAWLQFYGGPQEGTLKRLTSLDDEVLTTFSTLTLVSAKPSPPIFPANDSATHSIIAKPSEPTNSSDTKSRLVLSASPANSQLPDSIPFSPKPDLSSQSLLSETNSLDIHSSPKTPNSIPAKKPRSTKISHPNPSVSTSISPNPSVDTSIFIPSTPSLIVSFADFAHQWGHLLKFGKQDGKLRICEVIFNNTHLIGLDSFLSSYEQLGKLTQLSKKSCQLIIPQLELSGFLERLAIYNTATRKGTLFRLHLFPSLSIDRKKPGYFLFDSELPT